MAALLNSVVNGDCTDVLPHLPAGSIDLVHTSPPYNIEKPYVGHTDHSDHDTYLEFLASVIGEMARVVKPGGSVFWQTGYTQVSGVDGILPIDHLTHPCFQAAGFVLWDRIIWRYFGGQAFHSKFTNRHETILWYVKPDKSAVTPCFQLDDIRESTRNTDARNNFWGRNPGNVWEVDRVAYGSNGATSHIAVYPEEVTERIIRAMSPATRSAVVLDPFAGSGTTPKMARMLGRSWVGIEISEHYSQEAVRRIEACQPSEPETLLSEVVKLHGFGGRSGTAVRISDLARRLSRWRRGVSRDEIESQFIGIVQTVFPDGFGGQQDKENKIAAWAEFEALLDGSPAASPLGEADRILLAKYPHRRHLNAANRYRIALRVVDQACEMLGAEETEALVLRLAAQEPASFTQSDGTIVLAQACAPVDVARRQKGSQKCETLKLDL